MVGSTRGAESDSVRRAEGELGEAVHQLDVGYGGAQEDVAIDRAIDASLEADVADRECRPGPAGKQGFLLRLAGITRDSTDFVRDVEALLARGKLNQIEVKVVSDLASRTYSLHLQFKALSDKLDKALSAAARKAGGK